MEISEIKSRDEHRKDKIVSSIIAFVGVWALVGNAYMVNNIGYPKYIESIGAKIESISIYFIIPPAIPLLILQKAGIEIPLRGRESFIESNLWLWFYCSIFYAIFMYIVIRCYRWVKHYD